MTFYWHRSNSLTVFNSDRKIQFEPLMRENRVSAKFETADLISTFIPLFFYPS